MSLTKAIDPQEQAVFDAMFALMANEGVPTCNSWANQTGSGVSYGISVTAFDGTAVTHTYFTPGIKITVTPSSGSLGPDETLQFTATATNADNTPVDSPAFTWSLTPGNPGTIDATGLYTAPATIPNQTAANITCALTGATAWASVIVSLHP